MNLAYQHLLLAMLISFVTSANAEPVKTEFLINNNDIEKCIGTTNATPTLSFPPGSKSTAPCPLLIKWIYKVAEHHQTRAII